MPETFTPKTWFDGAGGGTPIIATELNRIENGIESMDDRVAALESTVVFNVRNYGALGDGTTNDTTAIQGAINAAIAAGGGIVWFPTGVYLYNALSVSGTGNKYLTLEGADKAILLAAPGLTTDSIVIDSSAATITDPFIRRIKFKNLMIQGNADWQSGTRINRRGVVLGRCQDIYFQDVWISQFRAGGLILDDCLDSVFHNVQILWCGIGASDADFAYALKITGTVDNSNSNHFAGCHMEFTPLTLSIGHNSRHNHFTNCKFEHGSGTAQNDSTKSPVYLADSLENTFTSCLFTENKITDVPYVQSDDNASLASIGIRKMTQFVGCSFFATSTVTARWYAGYSTLFQSCNFQRCNGALSTYVFDLASVNVVRDCVVSFADAGAGWMRITGQQNIVADNKVYTASSGTANSLYTIGSSASNNRVEHNHVIGAITSLLATTLTTLGTNLVSNRYNSSKTVTGGSTASVFTFNVLNLNDSTPATYTNFLHGYNGLRLMVIALTGNATVANNANIVLRGGADKLLSTGESISLENVAGVWRETSSMPTLPMPPSGAYLYTSSPNASATSAGLNNGTLRLVPWVVTRTITISRIGTEVTVIGDVGSKVRLGIYADTGSSYPGALVIDAGQIAGDSATVQELTVSQILTPGIYWVGGVVQSVTTTQPTLRSVGSSWTPPGLIGLGTSIPSAAGLTFGYNNTGVTAALPGTFGSTVAGTGVAPRIFVKVA